MANVIGGYALVDCTGLSLTKSTKQTITGVYNRIKSAYDSGKLVLLTNTGSSPMPVMVTLSGTTYTAKVGPLVIDFTSDDGAKITDNTPTP